jgi:hypothetical protein
MYRTFLPLDGVHRSAGPPSRWEVAKNSEKDGLVVLAETQRLGFDVRLIDSQVRAGLGCRARLFVLARGWARVWDLSRAAGVERVHAGDS